MLACMQTLKETGIGYHLSDTTLCLFVEWSAHCRPDLFTTEQGMYGVLGHMWSSGSFWLCALLLITGALIPDLCIRAYRDLTTPLYIQEARDKRLRSTRPSSPKRNKVKYCPRNA